MLLRCVCKTDLDHSEGMPLHDGELRALHQHVLARDTQEVGVGTAHRQAYRASWHLTHLRTRNVFYTTIVLKERTFLIMIKTVTLDRRL